MGRRELKALAHDGDELLVGMRDAAAGATEGKARAQYAGISHALGDSLGVGHAVGIARARDLQADLGHGLVKEFAVLAALDGGKVTADHLDTVLVERAVLCQLDGGIQTGLAAQRGQQGVRALFLDHALDKLGGDRLNIGAVGQARVGHDGRRIGVDQDDLKAILLEHLAGLGAGVVELAGLTDNDGARTNNEDALDVSTFRHVKNLLERLTQCFGKVSEGAAGASGCRDARARWAYARASEAERQDDVPDAAAASTGPPFGRTAEPSSAKFQPARRSFAVSMSR